MYSINNCVLRIVQEAEELAHARSAPEEPEHEPAQTQPVRGR